MQTKPGRDIISPAGFIGIRPKLRYRNTRKNSFELFGRLVKPGQIIVAYPEEIPSTYLAYLEVLDSPQIQVVAEQALPEVKRTIKKAAREEIPVISTEKEAIYDIVMADEENETFNVVNSITGKTLNDSELTLPEAEKLVTALKG